MNTKTESRFWLLTFNNPQEHAIDYDHIISILESGAKLRYYCMSQEIGLNEHTPHIHLYVYFQDNVRFKTIKNKFPSAHIDYPQGTPQQNRDYVFKEGKWLDDPKGETNLRDTHVEYGVCPVHRPGARTDLSGLYDLIKEGLTDYEILEKDPQYINQIERISKVRKTIMEEKYKNEWRDLEVTYIWGVTATGKTRGVMQKYGYSNVYRVTDYDHPWDGYKGEDVVIFEEFRSSLRMDDMLKYLDGYPVQLPARYSNNIAMFHKVYFCTNIDIREQYPNIQREEKETWNAFLRRIHKVKVYLQKDDVQEFGIEKYMEDIHVIFKDTPFVQDGKNHLYTISTEDK